LSTRLYSRALILASLLVGFIACADDPAPPPAPLDLGIAQDCNPLAMSSECLFPFPSSFFQAPDPSTPTGVRSALHDHVIEFPPTADGLDLTVFNRADGYSPTAPILVHLGVDVEPAQLVGQREPARWAAAGAPIALFDVDTGEQVPILAEMDQNQRTARYNGRHALILRPMVPMVLGHRHVAVLTSALRDDAGAALPVSRGFVALRDDTPTTHTALEASRPAYEELFTFLAGKGYARADLALAFEFHVASERHVLGGILSMKEQALALAAMPGELTYTVDNVIDAPNANVLKIVEGTFQVPTFLQADNRIARDADDGAVLQPERQSFPYTIVIPARAATDGPLPLVLFGHGVFGQGRDYLEGGIGIDLIQPLAQELGAVVVATDFIGLSSGDQTLLTNELVMDLNRVVIVMDRLQQAIINNLVLVELVRNVIADDVQVRASATAQLLTDDVYYYGVSLGGIQGASIVSLSPRISRAVLAVPGGAWATMLTRSVVYQPIKQLVDLQYPDPLVQQLFIALLQERFDGSDGANVAQLAFRRPLPDAPASRRIAIHEAIGDCQVPNLVTRILARAMGAKQITPFVEEIPLLETVTSPTTEAAVMQVRMPTNLADYTPPDENLVPDHDNGVHSESLSLVNSLDLVRGVLGEDVIRQTCTGACDPD
jgi:hypothetical protein